MSLPVFIAIGTALLAGTTFLTGAVAYKIIDTQFDKEDTCYMMVTPNADQPKGGFRLILVNQKKSWNKAVRIYPDQNVESWTEVKCGDSTGTQAKTNPDIKYDCKVVNFQPGKTIKLAFMKPGALGVWKTVGGLLIPQENQHDYDGHTIYVYYDDNKDNFFNESNKSHRLVAKDLM